MKKRSFFLLILILVVACKPKNDNPESASKMKETTDYVFTCNLKNDPEIIKQYRHLHSEDGVWPEVIKTFKATGASHIKIFIQDTRIVLMISLPEGLSFNDFQQKYETTAPNKIKEWDALMASFQMPPPGAEEGQTWVPMDLMFDF